MFNYSSPIKNGSFVELRTHTLTKAQQRKVPKDMLAMLQMIRGRLGTVVGEEGDKVQVRYPRGKGISDLRRDITVSIEKDELDIVHLGKPKFNVEDVVCFDFDFGIVKAINPYWSVAHGYDWLYRVHKVREGELLVCPDSRCNASRGDFTEGCAICSWGKWANQLKLMTQTDVEALIEAEILPKR